MNKPESVVFRLIDYAVRKRDLKPQDAAVIGLLRQKLAVPGNDPIDLSGSRLAALRQQLEPRLKSVLRRKDFEEFDLDRAYRSGHGSHARLKAMVKRNIIYRKNQGAYKNSFLSFPVLADAVS